MNYYDDKYKDKFLEVDSKKDKNNNLLKYSKEKKDYIYRYRKIFILCIAFIVVLFFGCNNKSNGNLKNNMTSFETKSSLDLENEKETTCKTSDSKIEDTLPTGSITEVISNMVKPSAFYNVVRTEKNEYKLGDEVNLELSLFFRGEGDLQKFFLDGPIYVKIEESSYFDITSEIEQIYINFSYDKNVLDSSNNQIRFKFKIIPKLETKELYKHLIFKLKANFDFEKAMEYNPYWALYPDFYREVLNQDDEYFFMFSSIIYLIDEDGIHFINNVINETLPYGIGDSEKVFYDRLNTKYEKGIITEDEYILILRRYICNDQIYVNYNVSDNTIYYLSENIRADFINSHNNSALVEKYNNKLYDELAKELILILYENKYINKELYDLELNNITNNHVITHFNNIMIQLLSKDIQDKYDMNKPIFEAEYRVNILGN